MLRISRKYRQHSANSGKTSGNTLSKFRKNSTTFLPVVRSKKKSTILEKDPLEKASKKKQLKAFKHYGFWKCMDTKRDRDELSQLSRKGFFKKKLGI